MTDETDDEMEAAAPQAGEKRPVGRPPGLPKTGGRPKGSKNRLPEEFRRFIDQRGRPLELLAAIARGNKVTAADPADPTTKTRVYPTLGERTVAARALLDRLLPALKATELSGPGGAPVQFGAPVNGLDDPNAELARRLFFFMETARRSGEDGSPEQVVDAEVVAAPPLPDTHGLGVGYVEHHGPWQLRLAERFPDQRERWVAVDAAGTTVAVGFGRQAVLDQLGPVERRIHYENPEG